MSGHDGLFACKAGFNISEKHPFLGVSPDAYVHDSSSTEPFGLAEIKCPYRHREVSPVEACSKKDFCCMIVTDSDGEQKLKLKQTHTYFAQVQGQMAVTERKWCDFVVYTKIGTSVERIAFDSAYWEKELLH